jgi:N-acetylneuraminate synthase
MADSIQIGKRWIGHGHPVWIVAELSGNHSAEFNRAVDTIHAAAEAGADAIKIQTYTADSLTIDSDRADFIVPGDGPWGGRKLYELYEEAHTPWDWHAGLFEAAADAGIQIFSSPFDAAAVRLLDELGSPAHKIASCELVDDALLECVAASNKPIVMSTGMAQLGEIAHALDVLHRAGADDVVLLRCTSSYPAPDESMNLRSIPVLAQTFDRLVGLSDHSLGLVAPLVAVALGACVIEKHFTLDRSAGGVDSHFSIEPHEFRAMVDDVRRVERVMGAVHFGPSQAEADSVGQRRSLFVVEPVRAGEEFTARNVRSIRPGAGLSPKHLGSVIGRRAGRDVERGTPFSWALLSPHED